ncbi:MAG: DNA alkylation repair protein [Proteobacteria bacterium]|nr:MAG: DNA alkylation repair protein [Rhodobacterales bacterium]PIE16663.1 MAG: DNA alkylation repair protein [Pseudomonadota bacterium]
MTPEAALAAIRERAEPGRAADMAHYHKQSREVIGVSVPALTELATEWRRALSVEERVALARALWDTDIFEARIGAAKLLTQARIRPDAAVWELIQSWVPEFDSWAIADHACKAGERRLKAAPERLDDVEPWTRSEHMWTRRAALVITLPWASLPNPKPAEIAARERILGWAAGYVPDQEWFIQKAIAWWLRTLSKHDPERVAAFLDSHGTAMKPFARKEAGKYIKHAPSS